MIDFDFLADLPAPEDDEPASLRSDIEDELADHLQCAMRREILKDGNETAAETRVLDRFGDPKKLARRLWWQAMWSRIMGKRILSGLQWMLTLTAVVLAGAVLWQQSSLIIELRTAREADTQKFEAIAEVMQELKARTTVIAPESQVAAVGDGKPNTTIVGLQHGQAAVVQSPRTADELSRQSPQSLTVDLVSEDGQTQIDKSDVNLSVVIDGAYAEPVWVPLEVTENGEDARRNGAGSYVFRLPQPSRCELRLEMEADKQYCDIPILVRSNEHRNLTIVCPNPSEKAIVHLTAPPLPSGLRAGCDLHVVLMESTEIVNDIVWRSNNSTYHLAKFDGQGGTIKSLVDKRGQTFDLRAAARPDRAIVLLAGSVKFGFEISHPASSSSISWPENGQSLTHPLSPGENNWIIELPEELLNKATSHFLGTPYIPEASSPSAVPATALPHATVGHDIPAFLSIKLVEGSVDGPPVLGATALLSGESMQETQIEESHTFPWDEKKRGMPVPMALTKYIKGNVFRFSGLKPDRYTLKMWLSNDQTCTQTILVRDEKPQELTIICPQVRGSDKSPVLITAPPLPEDLQQAGTSILCLLTPVPFEAGNTKWEFVNKATLVAAFHGNGELYYFEGANLSADTPPEDRVVFLPQSRFRIRIKIVKDDTLAAGTHESSWPKLPGDELIRSVTAGENRWTLEVSEEVIAAARNELANTEAMALSPVPQPSVNQKNVAEEIPLGDKSRWIFEFKSESESGRAQTDVSVSLFDSRNERINSREPSREYRPDGEGRCVVGPIDPGRYSLLVRLPEDRTLKRKLPLIRPGQERIERIVCPKPAARSTALVTIPPVQEDLRRDGIEFRVQLVSDEITLDGNTWSGLHDGTLRLSFDVTSGLVSRINDLALKDVAAEDRAVLIRTGSYRLVHAQYVITQTGLINGAGTQKIYERELAAWPTNQADQKGELQFNAGPGENQWEIKMPEEFWAKARVSLAELPKE